MKQLFVLHQLSIRSCLLIFLCTPSIDAIAFADGPLSPMISEPFEYRFPHPVFKFAISRDGTKAVVVTIFREKEPVYAPATATTELWSIDLPAHSPPHLECRFPGRLIPIVTLSDSGDMLYYFMSDLIVSLIPMFDGPQSGFSRHGVSVSSLLVRGHNDPVIMAECPYSETAIRNENGRMQVRVSNFDGEDKFVIPDVCAESLDYCPFRNLLVIGGCRKSVDVWDVTNQKQVGEIPKEDSRSLNVKCNVSISDDGRFLAISDGGGLSVWGLPSPKLIMQFRPEKTVEITSCKFIREGLLATFHRSREEESDTSQDIERDNEMTSFEGIQLWHVEAQKTSKGPFIPLLAPNLEFSSGACVLWKDDADRHVLRFGMMKLPVSEPASPIE